VELEAAQSILPRPNAPPAAMIIRILADREPYSAFPCDFTSPSLSIINGPAGLDGPLPDILVLPAEDFLALRRFPSQGEITRYMPYGPVSLMEKSFQWGCADYLREPWSLLELRARAGRFLSLCFMAGEKKLELRGSRLSMQGQWVELSDSETILLRVLALNAPLPVPREAAQSLLASSGGRCPALGRIVSSLRRKLEELDLDLGLRLLAIRGLGYRLDASGCG